MREIKFLTVKSVEFLKNDEEFGGNFAYFKFIFEECGLLKKNELVYTMNKIKAEAIKNTKMFPIDSMPNNNIKSS